MSTLEQPQTEQSGINRLFEGLGDALRAEMDQLQAERVEANAKLLRIDAELRKARKLLGIVDPDAPDVVTTKKKGNKKAGTTVGLWREAEVTKVLAQHPDGLKTTEVAEILGWKPDTTRIAISQARDKEMVRKAGYEGPAAIWKAYTNGD